MKTAIHPKYFDTTEIKCSCGHVTVVGSTRENMKTELCSNCHPFYTGQTKLVDTAGRVDKFHAKRKLSEQLKEESKKRAETKGQKKVEEYKEKEVPAEVIQRAMADAATEKQGKWGKPLGETLTEETAKEDAIKLAKLKTPARAKTTKKPVTKKTVAKKTTKKK